MGDMHMANSRNRTDHQSISSGNTTCCSHLCSQVIRTVLFIFNFIFWALGGTLLVLGVYLKIEYRSLDDISEDNFGTWMYGLIIVGSIIFVISFLGCCGTLLQSNNLLMLYFMLLILLVFTQIGCGIWAYTIRNKIFSDLEDGLQSAVAEYNNTKDDGNQSVIKDAIDSIQSIFKCCGHDGRADYNGNPPRSCCPRTSDHNLPHCSEETYHNVGCKDKIPEDIKKNLWLIGIILGALLFLEVAGLSAGCYLRVQIVKADINRWQNSYNKL
ncbi:hypothetical protein ACHWQZ_G001222 [Mnemiopsis leidyi]